MGKTHEEAEKLQNDHKKFETTAQVSKSHNYNFERFLKDLKLSL